ncbi:hypothetical protein AHAS_Ahas15G0110600 [Arachis hypogaea]
MTRPSGRVWVTQAMAQPRFHFFPKFHFFFLGQLWVTSGPGLHGPKSFGLGPGLWAVHTPSRHKHFEKIQATVKKQLLNRFKDHILEGQVYRMAYFTVVSNHGSYRATHHEFKQEYTKEEKIVKMIVLELTSKDLTIHCALFGEYVNQVNHFLASGYVEQPVVVIQLAKVKFFRGVNGTQPLFIANEGKVVSLEDDFMRLTRRCTIEELQDNNEEDFFVIFGIIRGIVEDESWWYSACVCRKGIYPQNGAYYCDFCVKHITSITPRFKIKITFEDHNGEGVFILFDHKASYLVKKSCADLFTEIQKDASVDTKGVEFDKFFGTFCVRRVCDDPTIITMFELPDYDADDELWKCVFSLVYVVEPALQKSVVCWKGDNNVKKESSSTSIKSNKVAGQSSRILCKSPILIDFFGGNEVAAVINDENGKHEETPENDTEVFSQLLDGCSQYGDKVIHQDHVVLSKGKRNLIDKFDEVAKDADGRGSKIAKVDENTRGFISDVESSPRLTPVQIRGGIPFKLSNFLWATHLFNADSADTNTHGFISDVESSPHLTPIQIRGGIPFQLSNFLWVTHSFNADSVDKGYPFFLLALPDKLLKSKGVGELLVAHSPPFSLPLHFLPFLHPISRPLVQNLAVLMLYLQPLAEVILEKYWFSILSHFAHSPYIQLLDVATVGANHKEHGQLNAVMKLVEVRVKT